MSRYGSLDKENKTQEIVSNKREKLNTSIVKVKKGPIVKYDKDFAKGRMF